MQISITHVRVGGSRERLGPIDADDKTEAKLAEIGFFDLPTHMPGDGKDHSLLAVRVVAGRRRHEVSFDDANQAAREGGLFDLIPLVAAHTTWEDIPDAVERPSGETR
jgi:hypothetical protein